MKVLFISSGNSVFGLNPIIINQGESLRKAGIQLEYFCIKGKGAFSYFRNIFLLRKYISHNRFDIFHAHYSLSAITASLAGCKPLVVSLMGSDTKSNFFWKLVIKLFSKISWKVVILKSSSMKDKRFMKKALIIPNGVDITSVKPTEEKALLGKKRILFAANPARYAKNYSLAKSAINLLDDDNNEFKVVHSKPHEDIINEINNADVLLLTSLWEGSPNIIKEAMACNCPVVSTDVGDVGWLFGNEPGHFLTTFDANNVAKNIGLAVEFSEKHQKTNGRNRIIELGLDSNSIAERIKKIYSSILET